MERGWARAFAASNLTADRLAEGLGSRPGRGRGTWRCRTASPSCHPPRAPTSDGRCSSTKRCRRAWQPTTWRSVGARRCWKAAAGPTARLPEAYRQPGSDEALRTLRPVAGETGLDAGRACAWLAHRWARVIPRHRSVPTRSARQRDHRGDDTELSFRCGRARSGFPASWLVSVAEDGGFEPPRAFTQHAFQACAIGH